MTKAEEEFDNAFKDKGGLFNIGALPAGGVKESLFNVEAAYKSIIGFLKPRYKGMPEINFGFIDNLSINACVRKVGDNYFLGLNIGAIFLVTDMFSKIFSSKNIFPEIGNVDKENEEKIIISNRIENNELIFDTPNGIFYHPKDTIRQHHTAFCISMAYYFIILHEIGHILRGHAGYAIHGLQNIEWDEMQSESKNVIRPIDFQTLEMDADSFATNNMYILIDSIIKSKSSLGAVFERV